MFSYLTTPVSPCTARSRRVLCIYICVYKRAEDECFNDLHMLYGIQWTGMQ